MIILNSETIPMIKEYPKPSGKKTNGIKSRTFHPQKSKFTPFPRYRIEDEAVIDEILNTLREEENAAHE